MSTTEKFLRSSMRTSSAALCQAVGWDATHSSALDVLSDVYSKYFMEIAKRIHHYAEHSGRSDANLEDVALVLDDMQVSVGELEEYVAHFDPVPFPVKVPQFPLEKDSHLNFLRPGSEEVVTRPVHVHEYMPPMIIEEENGKRLSKKSENELTPTSSNAIDKPDAVDGLENEVSSERTTDNVLTQVNGKIKSTSSELEVVDNTNESEDSDSDSSTSRILRNSKSPQSPKTPKSGKRLDSPGENPALKRVRMLLEEEGNPVKEITSVMMTTSGFLTSSREGKLPESKPPPNRDFFEPIPAVEKRKKIPTMKKIVEGVKKIEKDRDGDRERSDSSLGLFEKPDSIYTTGAAASDSSKERLEKDTDKLKEGKDRSKGRKDRNGVSIEKIKIEKKSLSHKDEGRDRQKLKIFKKKLGKDVTVKSKSKHRKAENIQSSAHPNSGITEGSDEATGLDAIESEEDFTTTKIRESSPSKKIRKKKEKSSHLRLKQKKLKLAAKKLVVATSGLQQQIKISKAQQKAAAAAALAAADPVRIFETPDQIVTAVVGSQKKKRGRPKKSASPFSISPISIQASPTTPIKSMKVNRKSLAQSNDEIDFKMMVPDISINVKPPEFMKKIPLQPGLIPAAFASPPSMKLPNQFPPSISVTPATPIPLSPGSGLKESARNSAQFGNLPSSVCSSVTITRIDMSSTQKLPTPFDNQSTPGIGSPNLSNLSNKSSSSVSSVTQPDSGITITPIVLEKQGLSGSPEKIEKMHPSVSGLAKLEQKINSKEQRKRDKEKRKELRKEKKKEKKEKMKEKSRKVDKILDKDRDKVSKKDKKDKSEKKRKKEKDLASPMEAIVPKLTLKLQHSSNSTPVDSPNPPQAFLSDSDHQINPVPRKITIKPIEETKSQHQRTPSPELARFSPLVTRPSKNKLPPLKKAPIPILKTPKQEIVSFPAAPSSSTTSSGGGKRGRGRPPKANAKTPGKPSSLAGAGTQAGLVTETVGSYIDEHGTKIWICPSCGRQDDGSPMIGCEKCDDWYHFACVGITEPPDENEEWFCRKCQDNKKARR